MTDHERYRRAFSAIQPSAALLEGKTMEKTKRNGVPARKLLALCAVLVLVVGAISVAYATDLGGFRVWINGELKHGTATQNANGTVTWTSDDGQETIHDSYTYLPDGTKRPMTTGEIVDAYKNYAVVKWDKEGHIFVSYRGQRIDITDEIQTNHQTMVEFNVDGKIVSCEVMRVDNSGNLSTDPTRFHFSAVLQGEDMPTFIRG